MAIDGNKVRQRRQQMDIGIRQVAQQMGVPHFYISKWETGVHKPGGENLVKLLRVLNCELEDVSDD